MSADKLGFWDYVKAAFKHGPRLPLLGRMPFNALALAGFGVLGLVNPGFWFVGAAAEIGYLTWLSNNDRFQAMVRGERMLAEKESYQQKLQHAYNRLSPASQVRYQRLLLQCQDIQRISDTLDAGNLDSLKSVRTGGLNQLLWIFLRMLTSHELLLDNVGRVDPEALGAEIADLEARLAAADADSALARSLQGTIEIQRKRLENHATARESVQVIEAELRRIEQQVVLVREEAAVSGKAEFLSGRLDEVTGALTETNRWLEQHAEIFGDLEIDPLGGVPEDLPEIPGAMETE